MGLLHAAATGAGFGEGLLRRLYAHPDADELHLYAEFLLGLAVIALTWARLALPGGPPHARGAIPGTEGAPTR